MIIDIFNYNIIEMRVEETHRLCPHTRVILATYECVVGEDEEYIEAYTAYVEEDQDGYNDALFETCFDSKEEAEEYYNNLIEIYG